MDDVDTCKERYKEISDIVKGDESASGLLKDLIRSASDYVTYSVTMHLAMKELRMTDSENAKFIDEEEFREKSHNLDMTKQIYHNTLMTNLNIFNRFLGIYYRSQTPSGGIYTFSPNSINDRDAVADWAGYFVIALQQLQSSKNK